ncbi:MAG: hypothetical protein JNM10_09740 [Planctomycetia bacterium]|nr:hypothetical protein [Planctomycetia bacterium]
MPPDTSTDRIPTLREALEQTTVADLRPIAALTGEPVPTRKDDLIKVVAKHFAGPALRALWERLDPLEQAAVAEAVHADPPRFRADRFRAKFGRLPRLTGTLRRGSSSTCTPLRVFFHGEGVIPDDLRARLVAFVPPPAPATVPTLDAPPAVHERTDRGTADAVPVTVHETARRAVREALGVLRLADAGKLSITETNRRPTPASVAEVAAILEGGDFYAAPPPKRRADAEVGPIRAFAWPMLVQAAGLVERAGAKLRLTATGRRALAQPPAELLRDLWQRWLRTSLLDELARVECVKGQTGRGQRDLTSPAERREAITRTLSLCPPERWIDVDRLLDHAWATGHEFTVARHLWHLYVAEPRYGCLAQYNVGRLLERRVLLCLLLEYAATLGLVDVALTPPAFARADWTDLWGVDELTWFSRYDGLRYVRITPLGAYVLGVTTSPPPEPKPTSALRILPTGEIVATDDRFGPTDVLALDACARRSSDRTWVLDATSLLAAVQAGRPIAELRAFLRAQAVDPLPATVERLLDDVERRCAAVVDRGLVRSVECASEALASELAHDARTRRHCRAAGGPFLTVPPASERAFRRGLVELGYVLADAPPLPPDATARTTRRRTVGESTVAPDLTATDGVSDDA